MKPSLITLITCTLHVICGLDSYQTLIWSANYHQHITYLATWGQKNEPQRKATWYFVSQLCFIKYQCSSTEEVSLRGIFHDRASVRGPTLCRMRCCATEKAVFYEDGRGLFCLLKYWGVYQCIPLLSGNLSQTASNIIFSVSVRTETNPSMFGESDENGSVWDLPCSWTYEYCLHQIAELSYWSNHIKSSTD